MNQEIYEKIEYALALIADKNDEGVDILYKYMGKTMLFVARGVTKDDFLAEDVVQESFLKIIQNIDQYKKGTNGYSWICRIVRNTAINAVRKSPQAETCLIDEFDYISDGRDYEDELTTKVLVEKLMNSLYPPIVKQMIYMKYFLDMTVREIAAEVGKSKSYVSKEILKAEKYMKSLL